MSNDAERSQCLLVKFTRTMQNLFQNDIKEYLNVLSKIEDWNKFKTIEDYIALNDKNINKALKELAQNEICIRILKEETNIDISIFYEL